MMLTRLSDRDDEVAEGAKAYAVEREFDLGALSIELGAAVGEDRVPLVAEDGVLWVMDDRVDQGVLAHVLQTHGLKDVPENPMTMLSPAKIDPRLIELAAKPVDEPYTSDEIEIALRALLSPHKES